MRLTCLEGPFGTEVKRARFALPSVRHLPGSAIGPRIEGMAQRMRSSAGCANAQNLRSTIIFLISAIAFAGFSPFGQVWAQFRMVWHR